MYYSDLSPNNYSKKESKTILSVGWLGLEEKFETGEVSQEFTGKLKVLCDQSINYYRGFHHCEFCSEKEASDIDWRNIGNGEIRIRSDKGTWYVAPRMIYHYVVVHQYKPPTEFVDCVLKPEEIGKNGEY